MRKLLSVGVVVVAVLAIVAPRVAEGRAQAAGTTTVVLTFDEGWASQSVVPAMLDAHGMKGTFYVNSGLLGGSRLSWAQLAQFAADGQEIGGGSLNDVDLTTLPAGGAQTSICEDRARLMNHGFPVTNFAYPFGVGWGTPAVKAAVQTCGYNSARGQWGLWSPGCSPGNGCGPNAESKPPVDPYRVLTSPEPKSTTTAATIESYVTNAASHGGGLVPIVFHQICNGCDTYSTPRATLQAFLTWLQTRAPGGTVVKTMSQVIGGAVQASPGSSDTTAPTSTVACNGGACSASYTEGTAVSVSFVGVDETGGSGLDAVRYTTDGSTPTIASPVYALPFNVTWNTTLKFAAWDNAGNFEPTNTQTILIPDTIAPASAISCDGVVCTGGWFNAGSQVSLEATDGGSGVKAIHFTTNGTTPALSSPTYTAPFTLSTSSTVMYFAVDNANHPEAVNTQAIQIDSVAPVAGMTCNAKTCPTAWYTGAVHVVLSARDAGGSGLAAIHYTIDNTTPTNASPVYAAPFTLSASKWVKFRAIDNAGNAGAVKTKLVHIDNGDPVVAIKSPGSHSHVTGSVKISIKTSDAKSGVAKIGFSIDGHHVTTVTESSLSFHWNTASASKGRHSLTAKAFDVAGNSATKAITVIVY